MNSIRHGAPVPVAPVFRMPVILPKLALGLMTEAVILVFLSA